MLVQENLKLFSPGHVSWNQSKQAFFPFETYVLPSQQDYGPNGTSIWNLRIWNFATAIWKVMLSKFPMIGPSCSFWKNTDLIGVSGSTTISNPPCSYPAPHSLSCYVWDAIRLALESSYPDLLCGWTRKWTIDPSSFDLRDFITTADFLGLHLSIHGLPIYSSCTSLPVCYYYSLAWHACVTSAFGFFALSLFLRPFHPWSINVTQLWLAWVGLRIRTVDPLPQSLPQSQAARLLNYVIRLPPLLRPRQLRHLWKPILHPTTSEPRPWTIHTQPLHFLMYLSLQSQVLPKISSSALTSHHEWSTRSTSRSLRTPTIPGSYSLKKFPPRGSPNVVILNITSTVFLAIGSGPYALRIIGATTLRFL